MIEKSYLDYLNKLVDQSNNTHHHSIGKNTNDADYSALIEETETKFKAATSKVDDGVRTIKYKNSFSKNYTKNWSKEMFAIHT